MPCPKDERLFKPHLGPTSVFHHVVFLLLLTHQCAGQSQVVTPSQPIVATLGDDIMLPCHLEPAKDATSETVEWARPDMDPRFVYLWRDGEELETIRHPSYVGRTSLSITKLKDGDISLKLDKVKVSDEGTYRCFVPSLQRESSVQLVVGATSSLIISLEKTDGDEDVSGAVLQCESKGWYPKPEVLWLDGEGKLLSAGPAEPIRGPDDLYTVSSRVTVEKKHSKSFTCRVQQKNINQTRETTFYVSDDLFKFPSSSSALTAGFAVSLSLCILLILLLVFFLWRRKRYKSKKTHQLEEGREREQLMSAETEKLKEEIEEKGKELQTQKDELEKKNKEMGGLKDGLQKVSKEKQKLENEKTKHKGEKQKKEKELQTLKDKLEQKNQEVSQQLQKEQKRRKSLEDLLETKNKEVKGQQAKVQRLTEEKQKKEKELQILKEELMQKNKEMDELNVGLQKVSKEKKKLENENKKHKGEIEEKEKELQSLKDELEQKNKEMEMDGHSSSDSSYQSPPSNETWSSSYAVPPPSIETRSSSYAVRAGKQQAEVQRLRDEMQEKEKELQTLMDYWKKENQRLEENRTRGNLSLSSIKLKEENLQRLTEEMWKKEKELQSLNEELEQKNKEDSSTPWNFTNRRPT